MSDARSLRTNAWSVIIDAGRLPDLAKLGKEFASKPSLSSEVAIPEPNLKAYDCQSAP